MFSDGIKIEDKFIKKLLGGGGLFGGEHKDIGKQIAL